MRADLYNFAQSGQYVLVADVVAGLWNLCAWKNTTKPVEFDLGVVQCDLWHIIIDLLRNREMTIGNIHSGTFGEFLSKRMCKRKLQLLLPAEE